MSRGKECVQPEQDSQQTEPLQEAELILTQIADSRLFKTAPMMRSLLLYLWKHRTEPISEYAIAVDALGRRPNFDPKEDATVRVQLARLRARLKEFYAERGDSFPLYVSIPVGGHQLKCVYTPIAPAPAFASPKSRPSPSVMLFGLASASIVLLLICLALFTENRKLKASAPSAAPSLPLFWQAFLSGGKPTNVVVPTPVYFDWLEQNLTVRDLRVPEYDSWTKSPLLAELGKRWGPPVLDQKYAVIQHILPAVKLIQYLERRGVATQLVVPQRLDEDSYRDQNIILIGGPRTTARFQAILGKKHFEIVATNPTAIRNLDPEPGEPDVFRDAVVTNQHIRFPGIIALLPRSPEGAASLLLIGSYPSALVSMLSSAEGLNSLNDRWKQRGRPASWEMVVQGEMDGDTILSVRPLAFRARLKAQDNPQQNKPPGIPTIARTH
jgi:hypothetical protein